MLCYCNSIINEKEMQLNSKIKKQQQIALLHPCLLAIEVTDKRFAFVPYQGVNVVLTINTGWE